MGGSRNLCPGLIAYKLMSPQRKLHQHGISTTGSLSSRITRIIVESAALYSLNHLLYVILYEVKDQVESTPSFLVSLAPDVLNVIDNKEFTRRKQVWPA